MVTILPSRRKPDQEGKVPYSNRLVLNETVTTLSMSGRGDAALTQPMISCSVPAGELPGRKAEVGHSLPAICPVAGSIDRISRMRPSTGLVHLPSRAVRIDSSIGRARFE